MENYIVINGKKAELTQEQLEALGIKTESVFNRTLLNKSYYYIGSLGDVCQECEFNSGVNDKRYEIANYCTDTKLMIQRALHETLNRLLWRFACENGELENEWDSSPKQKDCHYHYHIYFSRYDNLFYISKGYMIKCEGIIYFPSYEIAQQALNEIVKPFIKEHPEFVW